MLALPAPPVRLAIADRPALTPEQQAAVRDLGRRVAATLESLARYAMQAIREFGRTLARLLTPAFRHLAAALNRPRPPRRSAPHLARPAPMACARGYHQRARRRHHG